jgi:outer membrane protein
MIRLILFLCCCVYALALPALAAPPEHILTLEQAQQRALTNHPRLGAADLYRQAAKAGVDEARADYYPHVSLNGVRAFENDNPTRLAATGDLNAPSAIDRASYGVTARQLLTDFGRTNSLVDAAQAEANATAQRYLDVQGKITLGVSAAYYDVLKAQAVQEIARSTLNARRLQAQRFTALLNAGQASTLDVSIAQQAASEAELLQQQAHAAVTNAMATLAAAMGEESGQQYTLAPITTATQPPPPQTLEDVAQAVRVHPEIKAALLSQQAATAEARAASKARYPVIRAVGYAGETPYRRHDSAIDENYSAAGITVSVPLFTGGLLKAKETQLSLKAQALQRQVDEKQQQLMRDISIVWNTAQTAYDNIAVAKELDATSQQALNLAQARYNLGKNSIVELSQIQLTAIRATIRYQSAVYEYFKARETLKFFLGEL